MTNILSAMRQTWCCSRCNAERTADSAPHTEPLSGAPPGWWFLEYGGLFCSAQCLALGVLAMPDCRPHIVAQLAAEALK